MTKLFGGLKMSWLVVALFAVCAGVYTGIVASIPLSDGTSFRDIAISLEWWVIFAFVIAANCGKTWESALKIFAFFVISQPLVYLVEVLVGHLDSGQAWYYYSSIWGPATLLTLPGGFIAFFIKKQNPLGCVVLGLGCALQVALGLSYVLQMLGNPPFHLLSALVCFGSAAVFIGGIQESKERRAATACVALAAVVLLLAVMLLTGRVLA